MPSMMTKPRPDCRACRTGSRQDPNWPQGESGACNDITGTVLMACSHTVRSSAASRSAGVEKYHWLRSSKDDASHARGPEMISLSMLAPFQRQHSILAKRRTNFKERAIRDANGHGSHVPRGT